MCEHELSNTLPNTDTMVKSDRKKLWIRQDHLFIHVHLTLGPDVAEVARDATLETLRDLPEMYLLLSLPRKRQWDPKTSVH